MFGDQAGSLFLLTHSHMAFQHPWSMPRIPGRFPSANWMDFYMRPEARKPSKTHGEGDEGRGSA